MPPRSRMNQLCDSGTEAVTLREKTEQDAEFLYSVYASTREEELAQVGWDAGQKEHFLRGQFEAQRQCYESNYPGAEFQVILVEGKAAGRLYVDRRANEIRIMDIALLPEFRGQGIGTGLLKSILAEGQRTHRLVSIHVEVFNPAIRLYERLGFTKVALNGVYHLLEWSAEPARETAQQQIAFATNLPSPLQAVQSLS
jgi:ribosomal protein S18 acetylase RimI-like enzyme